MGKGNEAEQLRFASSALLCAWALHIRDGGWRGRLTSAFPPHSGVCNIPALFPILLTQQACAYSIRAELVSFTHADRVSHCNCFRLKVSFGCHSCYPFCCNVVLFHCQGGRLSPEDIAGRRRRREGGMRWEMPVANWELGIVDASRKRGLQRRLPSSSLPRAAGQIVRFLTLFELLIFSNSRWSGERMALQMDFRILIQQISFLSLLLIS